VGNYVRHGIGMRNDRRNDRVLTGEFCRNSFS